MNRSKLLEFRKYICMTQESIADKLELNPNTYAYYEEGKRKLPVDVAKKLLGLGRRLEIEKINDEWFDLEYFY